MRLLKAAAMNSHIIMARTVAWRRHNVCDDRVNSGGKRRPSMVLKIEEEKKKKVKINHWPTKKIILHEGLPAAIFNLYNLVELIVRLLETCHHFTFTLRTHYWMERLPLETDWACMQHQSSWPSSKHSPSQPTIISHGRFDVILQRIWCLVLLWINWMEKIPNW